MQAHAILTVAEGKRLIAKAVVEMPIIKKAMEDGIVIICKGTTNTYIVEEMLQKKIEHGSFVLGKVLPEGTGNKFENTKMISEIVLVKGELKENISLQDAVKMLKSGDVVIKGANMLDYKNKLAGVWLGSPTGGTTGIITPYVVNCKVHLIIPIGLEKQIAGEGLDVTNMLREPIKSLTNLPSMFALNGQIVTEIEALNILADVKTFQASAGGIVRAEGSCWLVWRGDEQKVRKALEIIRSIQGEKPFGEGEGVK